MLTIDSAKAIFHGGTNEKEGRDAIGAHGWCWSAMGMFGVWVP
jgi:hypothetical protein